MDKYDKILLKIYARYNLSEDEPDIVTVVDDINYLLNLAGYKHDDDE